MQKTNIFLLALVSNKEGCILLSDGQEEWVINTLQRISHGLLEEGLIQAEVSVDVRCCLAWDIT